MILNHTHSKKDTKTHPKIIAYSKLRFMLTVLIVAVFTMSFIGCSKTEAMTNSDAPTATSSAAAAATPTPQPSDPSYTAWLITEDFYSTVNVRSEPQISEDPSNTIVVLHDRDQIYCTGSEVTDSDGNIWFEVTFGDTVGYILSEFVGKDAPKSIVEELSEGVEYSGVFTQLVRVESLTPYVLIDLTLADDDNFISDYTSSTSDGAFYSDEIALVQYSTGLKLAAAAEKFHEDGYQLVLWDAYRPYSVSVAMYEIVNDPKLIADPAKGSKHNRGAAVDVTLYKDGVMVDLPTTDRVMDVSEASRTSYMSTEQRKNMDYLTEIMESCGFITYRNEWWHFNDSDWENYPLMDFPLYLFADET